MPDSDTFGLAANLITIRLATSPISNHGSSSISRATFKACRAPFVLPDPGAATASSHSRLPFVTTNVAKGNSEMQEKCTEKTETKMRGVAEASLKLREIAEPAPVGDSVKAAINRAAARVSRYLREWELPEMTPGRAEDLWYGEARRVHSEEMDAIRAAHEERRRQEGVAIAHAEQLGKLFAGAADRLGEIDQDIHRDDIAALVGAARALGALRGAMAETEEGR